MWKPTATLAAVSVLMALPVCAQPGLFVGAHAIGASLNKVSLQETVAPLDFGAGTGMHAGLAFGGQFGLLVNHDRHIASVDAPGAEYGQWDVLGRVAVRTSGAATTFATAGLSKRVMKSSDDGFPIYGMNPTAGLTGQVHFALNLALEGGVLLTFGSFQDGRGQRGACVARLVLGASYYLLRDR